MDSPTQENQSSLDLEAFACAMRHRFPDADFARMLANSNLDTILACLRGTWVEQHVGHDVGRFRALLQHLASMPKPVPVPVPLAKRGEIKPEPSIRLRIQWRRMMAKDSGAGVLWTTRKRCIQIDLTRRQRHRNGRHLDVAAAHRLPSGFEIH